MNAPEPITAGEVGVLAGELGFSWLTEAIDPGHPLVRAYRAGVRDGSKPPQTRVFRPGDPEPGPEVLAVLDDDGDVWGRAEDGWWTLGAVRESWLHILEYGPLVACALPDHRVAVAADAERRAADHVAGGAR